jgi:hypothetical protein
MKTPKPLKPISKTEAKRLVKLAIFRGWIKPAEQPQPTKEGKQ